MLYNRSWGKSTISFGLTNKSEIKNTLVLLKRGNADEMEVEELVHDIEKDSN